ncbi:cysteine hydrolase family protein [Pseudalkalibacillus salsuginis]|uniref:cysteine hydrolase family protein n=1 Tax=Pseudalkalibacillus salsuginis TaxID=2910972 RepID=UPI001F28E270|nr:cysteine hydrolase family protein [Pseudalkalibacillus salsuginis]MCF6411210.1 cysteine hydrolase [Pseudalkalibacillus salsuginis]
MKEVLIVIDVQQAVMEHAYEKETIINRISMLIRKARLNGVPVIYVQHEDSAGPLKRGETGWQLDALLEKPQETDHVIYKTKPNSFAGTSLKTVLEELGAEHLFICGAQTDYCVDSTCRGAFDADYDVTLIKDAHTTMDNDHFKAVQIIDHTNITLSNFWSSNASIILQTASEVPWMKEIIEK